MAGAFDRQRQLAGLAPYATATKTKLHGPAVYLTPDATRTP